MSYAALAPWWLGYSADPYPVDIFVSQLSPPLAVDASHVFILAETPPAFRKYSEMFHPRA